MYYCCIPFAAVYGYRYLGDYQGWHLHQLFEKRADIERYMNERHMVDNPDVHREWRAFNDRLLTQFDAYVKQFPKAYENHQALAELSVMNQRYQQAIQTYRILLEQNPESPSIKADLAQVIYLQSKREVPGVLSLVQQLLVLEPNNPVARFARLIGIWKTTLF